MSTMPRHVMPVADAARVLGCSVSWVKRLDAELRPERTPSGARRYDPQVVAEFLAKRGRP